MAMLSSADISRILDVEARDMKLKFEMEVKLGSMEHSLRTHRARREAMTNGKGYTKQFCTICCVSFSMFKRAVICVQCQHVVCKCCLITPTALVCLLCQEERDNRLLQSEVKLLINSKPGTFGALKIAATVTTLQKSFHSTVLDDDLYQWQMRAGLERLCAVEVSKDVTHLDDVEVNKVIEDAQVLCLEKRLKQLLSDHIRDVVSTALNSREQFRLQLQQTHQQTTKHSNVVPLLELKTFITGLRQTLAEMNLKLHPAAPGQPSLHAYEELLAAAIILKAAEMVHTEGPRKRCSAITAGAKNNASFRRKTTGNHHGTTSHVGADKENSSDDTSRDGDGEDCGSGLAEMSHVMRKSIEASPGARPNFTDTDFDSAFDTDLESVSSQNWFLKSGSGSVSSSRYSQLPAQGSRVGRASLARAVALSSFERATLEKHFEEAVGTQDPEEGYEERSVENEDAPSVVEGLQNVICYVGEKVSLCCTIAGLQPIEVTWYNSNRPMKDNHKYRIFKRGTNQYGLDIYDVDENDAGEITCFASNEIDVVASAASLTINACELIEEVPTVADELCCSNATSEPVLVGETLKLCVTVAGFPEPRVLFFKDGKQLRSTEDGSSVAEEESRIIIEDLGDGRWCCTIHCLSLGDSGQFEAVASNRFGSVTSSTIVTIQERPKPRRRLSRLDRADTCQLTIGKQRSMSIKGSAGLELKENIKDDAAPADDRFPTRVVFATSKFLKQNKIVKRKASLLSKKPNDYLLDIDAPEDEELFEEGEDGEEYEADGYEEDEFEYEEDFPDFETAAASDPEFCFNWSQAKTANQSSSIENFIADNNPRLSREGSSLSETVYEV